ncbi:hypothetical protein Tco_0604407 [Tanacetum coccineum]
MQRYFSRESCFDLHSFKGKLYNDRKLHLSMYRKASQLQKQLDAKSAWLQEKYSGHTHRGIGCSSSQINCPLNEKELHQLRMDEEALKEMLEEETMNEKAQEEKTRQAQVKNNAFFLEFGVVKYDSDRRSSVHRCNTRAYCATHHCGDWRGSFLEKVAFVRRCWFTVREVRIAWAGKTGEDGDLHSLSRWTQALVSNSVGTLEVMISWEVLAPVAGVKVSPNSGNWVVGEVGESNLLGMECPMAASYSGELSGKD